MNGHPKFTPRDTKAALKATRARAIIELARRIEELCFIEDEQIAFDDFLEATYITGDGTNKDKQSIFDAIMVPEGYSLRDLYRDSPAEPPMIRQIESNSRYSWCIACREGHPHTIHSSLEGSYIHPG